MVAQLERETLLREDRIWTPEEFIALELDDAELLNGRIVEKMPPFLDHGAYQGQIYTAIALFLRRTSLGRVFSEGMYRLPSGSIVAPDVSFISHKMLEGKRIDTYFEGVPTLAVEIISKNDSYVEVDEKADEFLEAGTLAVWIVNPRRKIVKVRTPDGPDVTYKLDQEIPGGEILPGFSLPVAEIFE